MRTTQSGHTPEQPVLDPTSGATQRGVVRCLPFIGEARTHAEPDAQKEEIGDEEADAVGELGIDIDEFQRLLLQERTKRAVKRTLDAEERPMTPMPPAVSLSERFMTAPPAVEYRIEDWFVIGGHVILVAQYKSGKTTTLGNFVRSVVDGDPFLGRCQVKPVGSVVMLDFEMSEWQIEAWLRDQNIRNTDRVHLVSLRGAASAFDILNPTRRREWAARLRDMRPEIVTVDCLRPAMDALGLNEHSDAGIWLTAFDELLKEAGVPEALIVHHSGHGGDRSRGDSRILDWPDGIWNLVRENRDDLNSPRFISAKGRDISVEEGQLTFHPVTRHLTYAPKDRKKASADKVLLAVVREVADAAEPMSIREVQAAMDGRGYSKKSIEAALKKASDRTRGYLSRVKGSKGAHLHSMTMAGRTFLASTPSAAEPA